MTQPFRADLLEAETRKHQKRRARLAAIIGATTATFLTGSVLAWDWAFGSMPKVSSQEELWTLNRERGIEFVDQNGATIAIRGPRYGRAVALGALPKHVTQAFLAVEDARFFEHGGVDGIALVRALGENILAGHTVQGGSTITQQLVKNVYLSSDRTLKRKFQEFRLAWTIESLLTKQQILELYLNRIYFGANAYGVDAASKRFFGKPPTALNLAEAAMLAGLPKAPSRLTSSINLADARARQHVVLDRMVTAGFLSTPDAEAAKLVPVSLTPLPDPEIGTMAFALDAAIEELKRAAPDAPPDLILTLTIDRSLQDEATAIVQTTLDAEGKARRTDQAAAVILDGRGRILAMVGGRDYATSQYNRVTQAKRQPGSAFKPIVFAAALEAGLTPDSIRTDRSVAYQGWRPKNYSGGYSGAMTLDAALARSVNTIAVQLAAELGPAKVAGMANRLGIDTGLKLRLSMALGAQEVSLLELSRVYATFAAEGVRIDPRVIDSVTTSRGVELLRPDARPPQQVYEAFKARQMTEMLMGVIESGTGTRARLAGREAAGKTGTSSSYRDAWFVGYTADMTAGVWVGNDDFSPMNGVTGGTLPALLWTRLMNAAHKDLPPRPLPTTEDLQRKADKATLVSFYESLADLFASASDTISAEDIGRQREAISPQ